MVDETSDVKQRMILQILVVELDALRSTKLEETNHKAVIAAIIRAKISFDNIKAFVSDNASYLLAAYRSLSEFWPNSTHVTCFAHILNLVGGVTRTTLNDLDSFVASIKAIFSKSNERRHAYIDHLRQHIEPDSNLKVKLPPSPCITRWNTGCECVLDLDDYFELIIDKLSIIDTVSIYQALLIGCLLLSRVRAS